MESKRRKTKAKNEGVPPGISELGAQEDVTYEPVTEGDMTIEVDVHTFFRIKTSDLAAFQKSLYDWSDRWDGKILS